MLLSFKDVRFSYNKSEEILKGITLDIREGEKVALLGLNGSGKSTLMLHINGLLKPSSGTVSINGKNTDSKEISVIRQTVGIVFQNPDDQLFMPTVREDVAFGPLNMKLTMEEVNIRVNRALEITGTLELADRAPFELSGGQKKAVSIATVLSMTPKLLVLDEPTSGLDYMAEQNFIKIIDSLPQAILMSTHDIVLAKKLCTRAIILDKGKIIYDGNISEMNYPL